MIYSDTQIFAILIKKRVLTKDSRKLIEGYMEKWDLDQYDALIQTNTISDEDLKAIIASELKIPAIDSIDQIHVSVNCLDLVTFDDAKKWWAIPIEISEIGEKKLLTIVISDPTSTELLNEIRNKTAAKLKVMVGTRFEVRTAIFREYPIEQQLIHTFGN